MARGREAHQAHLAALAALGRPLSRRARSRCELCGASAALAVVEVDGSPEPEPEEAWAVMLCEACRALVAGADGAAARFLQEACWSETRPAQLLAVRLLRRLDDEGVGWARETLDGLYLDPEVEALL